jgi:hypothetical protein
MNDEDEEFNRIEREASMRKEAVRATVAQQEPIKWMEMVVANLVREGVNKHKARELAEHFYTSSPAQRTWAGLTDEEQTEIMSEAREFVSRGLLDLVEAKLKEKNQ